MTAPQLGGAGWRLFRFREHEARAEPFPSVGIFSPRVPSPEKETLFCRPRKHACRARGAAYWVRKLGSVARRQLAPENLRAPKKFS